MCRVVNVDDAGPSAPAETMRIAQFARRAGVAPSAVRWYEAQGVLPAPARRQNGYRQYTEDDLVRLRLVVTLRRLGLAPGDSGNLARLCLEQGTIDADLAPLITAQRAVIARQRNDLDRLDGELTDLELTIGAAGRAHRGRPAQGGAGHEPIRVLFVCTGNSARSQMGEALLARAGGADFLVASAGTRPRSVSPYTVRVLREVGLDWSGARSKSVDEFVGQAFDYVITVCDRARQVCPAFPGGGNVLHWGLDDPAEVGGSDQERLAAFRRTRGDLIARLRPFIEIARRTAGLSGLADPAG
jgi:arsenate reductase (thioredoxin)